MFLRLHKLLLVTALLPLSFAPALAGPNGASVVAGTATVQGQGTPSVVVKQSSQSAIINWQTFNIGAGEKTAITMPGASSVELDRVTGGLGPSQIYGSLTSNGRVFLVNPDGILFGQGAKVNVGSLLATTHDIANSDFMAGNYNFSASGNPFASIVNQGSITAQTGGFAALVAPGVRNTGIISAKLGTVALASGNAFTLDFYGDNLITLGLNDSIAASVTDVSTGQPLSSLVSNTGTLKANGGSVELSAVAARAVVDSVINNTGVVEANTIGTHNGMIELEAATAANTPAGAPPQTVKVSGKLSAAGRRKGTGGTVLITGENVQLTGANLNASGNAGGGAVLVGGDWGGGVANKGLVSNPSAYLEPFTVPTAGAVSIDAASTINASATNAGNGGKIIVWSNESTTFYGTILAKGGALSGEGGFVETSGHQLSFNGTVNTSAPNGTNGTLLLDPLNATIDTNAGSEVITVSSIESALATGDVVVTTVGTTGSEAGDITVASSLSWANASTLTLNSYRNVNVNNGVTIGNTGAGNLVLRADETGTGVGTVNFLGSGKVDFSGNAGTVSIFYNPADSPAGSVVNATSYTTPFDYSPYVLTNNTMPGQLTEYMLVNSVYDLQNIENNLSGTYALGNDIDASATASWNGGEGFVPIGNGEQIFQHSPSTLGQPFTGILDGQGHTIDQLTMNASVSSVGLFGVVGPSGTIREVGLTDVSLKGGGQTGGLVGTNLGTIEDSYVSGSVAGAGGTLDYWVGGLVGENFGTISRSYSTAAVTSPTSIGHLGLGGLVGSNSGVISESYSSGSVTGDISGSDGANFIGVGGLVGQNQCCGYNPFGGTFTGTIINSYSLSSVVVNASLSTTGNVVATAAGLADSNFGQGAGTSSIQSSYAAGAVYGTPGTTFVGGLVESVYQADTLNAYWDTQTSGQPNSAAGTGKITTELKSGLPTGFDPTVWGSNPSINNGYPYLLWEVAGGTPASPTTLPPGTLPITAGQAPNADSLSASALLAIQSAGPAQATTQLANSIFPCNWACTAGSYLAPIFEWLSGLSGSQQTAATPPAPENVAAQATQVALSQLLPDMVGIELDASDVITALTQATRQASQNDKNLMDNYFSSVCKLGTCTMAEISEFVNTYDQSSDFIWGLINLRNIPQLAGINEDSFIQLIVITRAEQDHYTVTP